MRKYILLAITLVFLISCSSIPLTSLYKLSKVDLHTINPKVIAVAIKTPDYIRSGQINLKLSYTPEGEIEKPLNFVLVKYDGFKEYKNYIEKGYSISSYKLSESDAVELSNFRKKKFLTQKKDKRNHMTKVSVSFKDLCRIKEPKNEDVLISILLKTNTNSGFFPLWDKMDLKKEAIKKGIKVDKEIASKHCPDYQ